MCLLTPKWKNDDDSRENDVRVKKATGSSFVIRCTALDKLHKVKQYESRFH